MFPFPLQWWMIYSLPWMDVFGVVRWRRSLMRQVTEVSSWRQSGTNKLLTNSLEWEPPQNLAVIRHNRQRRGQRWPYPAQVAMARTATTTGGARTSMGRDAAIEMELLLHITQRPHGAPLLLRWLFSGPTPYLFPLPLLYFELYQLCFRFWRPLYHTFSFICNHIQFSCFVFWFTSLDICLCATYYGQLGHFLWKESLNSKNKEQIIKTILFFL